MNKICKTCKHWGHFGECGRLDTTDDYYASPKDSEALLFFTVDDDSGSDFSFRTSATFGCNLWERSGNEDYFS